MPAYPELLKSKLDFTEVTAKVVAMKRLGVPYTDADVANAEKAAEAQALFVVENMLKTNKIDDVPSVMRDNPEQRKVIALIAYIQRLGTDLYKPAPVAATVK